MSESDNQGLLSRIASSAEYSIAAALIAVCVVVGGALWWLRPDAATSSPEQATAAASARTSGAVDESAALEDAKRRLGEQFNAIDEQQRKRVADDEARRQRQRAEEVAAEARRQAERAAQARKADAETREIEQVLNAKSTPVPQPVVVARRNAVRTDAAIDWSSCKRPAYPQLSVKRGEEGVVVAAVDVDPSGQVQQLRVTRSSGHERLDRVTTEAIRKCRFTPAREDGIAKVGTAEVRMNWQLKE